MIAGERRNSSQSRRLVMNRALLVAVLLLPSQGRILMTVVLGFFACFFPRSRTKNHDADGWKKEGLAGLVEDLVLLLALLGRRERYVR